MKDLKPECGANTPYANPIMRHFMYGHLPKFLQDVSRPICDLAVTINSTMPDGPEKSAGLRKLLEAKDCIVRHAVTTMDGEQHERK